MRRIDGGVEIEVFTPARLSHRRCLGPSARWSVPALSLHIAVTLQRTVDIHFILFHVAGNFQLRNRHRQLLPYRLPWVLIIRSASTASPAPLWRY